MARKSKKRPAQRRPRPAAPVAAPQAPAPRAAPAGRRAQRGILIGDNDPAIPLDRVPYFVSDLAKLGIVAVAMLVLLLVGSQLIPLVAR